MTTPIYDTRPADAYRAGWETALKIAFDRLCRLRADGDCEALQAASAEIETIPYSGPSGAVIAATTRRAPPQESD